MLFSFSTTCQGTLAKSWLKALVLKDLYDRYSIVLGGGGFCDTSFEYAINKWVVTQGKMNNSMIENALRGVQERKSNKVDERAVILVGCVMNCSRLCNATTLANLRFSPPFDSE